MKFLTFESFDGHLRAALPEHPSSLYAILVPNRAERRYVIKHLLSYYPEGEETSYFAEDCKVEKFVHVLNSPSLFSEHRILIYDDIERLGKTELGTLTSYLKGGLPPQLEVILSGACFSGAHSFYQGIKKELVMLDLSREKPWEHKERLLRWLIDCAREKEKILAPTVAKEWVESSSMDFAALCNELEIWITFIGDQKTLDIECLKAIRTSKAVQTGWQLADAIIWGKSIDPHALRTITLADLQGLIGQLRYYLKVGLCIKAAIKNKNKHRLKEIFPNMRPQQLVKYQQMCSSLSEHYFSHGLQALSDCELYSRFSKHPQFLLTHFMFLLEKGREDAT